MIFTGTLMKVVKFQLPSLTYALSWNIDRIGTGQAAKAEMIPVNTYGFHQAVNAEIS